MKRIFTLFALSLVCVFCAIGFTACDENTAGGQNTQILGIYNTYVAYAEENGETPLSYEEWLESIKGENGKNGKDGINGIDGKDGVSIVKIEKTSSDGLIDTYTITYSNGDKATFTITNGKNGEKGDKGEQGFQGEKGDTGATGAQGEKGQDGKDGVSIKDATIDEDGNLIITLTDDTPINAGKVIAPAEKLDDNNKITFKSFTVEDKKVDGKVSNDTEIFYFNDEIEITGHAGYKVFRDFDCQQEIVSKTVNLTVGDNYFYILEYCGAYSNFYTVNVRRKPIYTVKFFDGENELDTQDIEEDSFAVDPKPVKNGYGYTWDYDFSTPITGNIEITATWYAIFTVSNNSVKGLTEYGKTLDEIIIPETIDGNEIIEIRAFAFKGDKFKTVRFTNKIVSIGEQAFYENLNLRDIYFTGTASQWTQIDGLAQLSIGHYHNLYINDEPITDITLEGISTIKDWAFSSLKSLTKVTIDNSVTSIGHTVFFYCPNLTEIIYNGTVEQWNNIEKNQYWQEQIAADKVICSNGEVSI